MNKIQELDTQIEALLSWPGELTLDEVDHLLDLGKQLDVELDKVGTIPEIELPPNVLQLDQNKRKRSLNVHVYKNNAQVIRFERKSK